MVLFSHPSTAGGNGDTGECDRQLCGQPAARQGSQPLQLTLEGAD